MTNEERYEQVTVDDWLNYLDECRVTHTKASVKDFQIWLEGKDNE